MARHKFIRLPGYDYASSGAYFVTLCTHRRACLFGTIANGDMVLSAAGSIVDAEWRASGDIREEVQLGVHQVMPNHLHAIVFLVDGMRRPAKEPGLAPAPARRRPHGPGKRSLAALVGGFKAAATKRLRTSLHLDAAPIWQANYYEHIIRNDDELERISEYILANPQRWAVDAENPDRSPGPADDDGYYR